MDHISKEHRSWNMSRIKSKNTKPELIVRSVLHSLGYRFRLNGSVGKKYYKKGILPGKPDIVLAKYKLAIFIHGCFWHNHSNCKRANIPKSNTKYWENKTTKNKNRDKEVLKELKTLGWKTYIVWECDIKKENFLNKLEKEITKLTRE